MNDVGTLTLSDFLLARITEDEAEARDALSPPNMYPWGDRSLPRMAAADWPDAMRGYLGGAWGEHGARWNPTRVLAECEAKRRIVAAHIGGEHGCPTSDEDLWAANWRSPCDTLRLLALPYADHPDYRQEWAV